ncbi:hypothetical protein TNCV_2628851 [Trichonephila clavipes]|uniref:Uncharacterized protein n=1 Tax=Trichonephila clavipes TaxID=2585209 RepID=A0A8X6SKT4_TRICX|nr:hypothetical protein TNCV_2628851 [Trichonephila clavipes]
MKDTCYMLAEALDSLERQSLKNAWNKPWPDLEGKKDFNDDHSEEIYRLYCDFVQKESDPVDDETDEDEDNNNNNESSKGPSNADAFSVLNTAIEWYEQQSECCPTQLLLLKRIRHLAEKKRRCTIVQ